MEQNNGNKNIERIKNLFKDLVIFGKKWFNDWIEYYCRKNIISELLFRTNVDGDTNTLHNKYDGKRASIAKGSYSTDNDVFVFIVSLDIYQKFVQYMNFNNTVYYNSSCGPTLGNGHDINIANDCKYKSSSYCYSN